MKPSGARGALLSAVLLVPLLVVGVSPVFGAVTSQTVSATATSSTQSPTVPHGVSLQLVMNTTWDSSTPTPLHKMGVFHLDNDFSIDTTGLATCDSSSVEGKTTASAIASCPGAMVGSGNVTLTTGGVTGVVTVFNGPPSGSDPTILAHVDIANGTVILLVPGLIQTSSRGGDFGTQISMGPFPNISGIGISHLAVTFNNLQPTPGHHYISATCSDLDHTWNYVVDFTYFDDSTRSVPAMQNCTPDSTPPAPPVLSATSPASPANDNNPRIIGTAEPGSTVRLYTSSDCTGTLAAQGSAGTFGSTGIRVSVANNSTTTYHATATDPSDNTSACSTTSISYTEDSTLIGVPELTASVPASPANENNPVIKGTAPAGTTVKLYTSPTCTGTVAGQATGAAFAGSGIAITVADDSTTDLYATATDSSSNTSACSNPAFTYVEDSSSPLAPSLSSSAPASPSQDNDPQIEGAAEGASTVKLYTNATCTSPIAGQGTAEQFAGGGIPIHVADRTRTTFFATATDPAGNTSSCSTSSLTYLESTPASLGGGISSMQTGQPIPGATVALFRSDSAGGPFAQVPDGDAVMSPANQRNPDTADASGHYGWDVITGFYRVHASAAGCASLDSQVVRIPPVSTDFNLALDCPSVPAGGGAGQSPKSKPKCKKAKKHKKHRASASKSHCKKKNAKKRGR